MAHYNMPDPIDINAEFGCAPHTPPTNDTNWKATWSSPRRKRVWGWGGSKHDRSSSGLESDEYKENSRPPPPGRRRSIKNMFSSVRNGLLLYNQMPTEFDVKDCGPAPATHQADSQTKPPLDECVPEKSSGDKPLHSLGFRRSKSLNFLGSLGRTLSTRRGSKQRLGMLSVYPGMDLLSRNQEIWDEEGSSSKDNDQGYITPAERSERSDADVKILRSVEPVELDANPENGQGGKTPGSAGRVRFEEPTKERAAKLKLMGEKYVREDLRSFDSESTIAEQPSQRISTAEDSLISRGNTPDSYLELLIESLCPPSDSDTCSISSSESPSDQDLTESFVPMTSEERAIHQRAEDQKKAASLLKTLEDSGIPVLRPQYCPDGYQTINQQDLMDQRPIVCVREVFDSPHTTASPHDYENYKSITHTEFEESEECKEYEYQSDGLTTHERIKTRIHRTLAVMTRNRYFYDSEDGSVGDTEFSWTLKQKQKEVSEVSEVSEPTSVSTTDASPPELRQPTVVRRGKMEQSSGSGYGRDSAVLWVEEIAEEDEKGDKPIGPSSNQVHNIDGKNLRNPSVSLHGGIPKQQEVLSSWGKSAFRSPSGSTFGPVQVNFPETATREGHTELYETRSEAISAIYHENHGEFDSFCTFDPTIRVIFVHPAGKFVPDFVEIRELGLEILSLPTDYDIDQAYLPYPLFSPQNKYSSVHEYKERISSINELTAMLSKTHLEVDKGKATEKFDNQFTILGGMARPTDMVPPNSPNSNVGMSPGLAEAEQEGSVFDDDFFLEVDLASHRSSPTCDLWQADPDHVIKSVPQQPDSASLDQQKTATETHGHVWEAKTWPELAREYLTTLGSPSSTSSIYGDDIDGIESQDDARAEFELSIYSNPSHRQGHRRVSSCEQFVIELRETENRSLQQVIDQIVDMKGATLDRGIALVPKTYSQATVEDVEDEEYAFKENTAPVESVCQEVPEMPHVQDMINLFEDRAATNLPEMRTFSYPLEYSPPPSRLDFDVNHSHHKAPPTYRNETQRHVSDASDQSNASGFRFTDYIQELAEIASNGSASTSHSVYDMENRVLASVEPCRPPVDANGSPRAITAEDLNVRLVGKAAQESRLARREANNSALVGLFQSHGLMPQSQPTLRSSTTLGSSPFKSITNRIPSANSSPTAARSGETEGDVEKAKATAFKRAFSELSVGSNQTDTDTLDFGEGYQVLKQMRHLW